MKILVDILVRKEMNAFVRNFTCEKLTLLGINKYSIIYSGDYQVQRNLFNNYFL